MKREKVSGNERQERERECRKREGEERYRNREEIIIERKDDRRKKSLFG